MIERIEIEDIKGFSIGHAQDAKAGTGVTVILSNEGVTGGVDVRGGAPATRETDLLAPENTVDHVDAVCLSGGSAFGLAAADGVMKILEEAGRGLDVSVAKVPIVCGACLFDLAVGDPHTRPDSIMGAEATRKALEGTDVSLGNVGAGTGATVGKLLAHIPGTMMKGGLGHAAFRLGDLQVGAIIAVNPVGNVVDPSTGETIAGVLDPETGELMKLDQVIARSTMPLLRSATVIGAIITNAALTKSQATKAAQISHDGIARSIRPSHTTNDGDALFLLASGVVEADVDVISYLACESVSAAIVSAVTEARSAYGLLAHQDLPSTR